MPSLEINGIWGGSHKTVIPGEATAKITARLVHGQSPEKIAQRVEQFLRQKTPAYADLSLAVECYDTPYAVNFKTASPAFRRLFNSMETSLLSVFGKKPLHLREGGSIGVVSAFKRIFNADSILVGIVPPDAQIHSPNEHISMDVLTNARRAFREFFAAIR
jgi:acetylornithine deacetylase/succinyl-diaminopimelate desuccinylase-like protein